MLFVGADLYHRADGIDADGEFFVGKQWSEMNEETMAVEFSAWDGEGTCGSERPSVSAEPPQTGSGRMWRIPLRKSPASWRSNSVRVLAIEFNFDAELAALEVLRDVTPETADPERERSPTFES